MKYKRQCFKHDVLITSDVLELTNDEFLENCSYFNISTKQQLIDRWNSQSESQITKIKWIYTLMF